MLIYHPESDSLFWDEDFDFDIGDPGCVEVGEELTFVERARDLGLPMPDIDRHLAYLRDLTDEGRPDDNPDHSHWGGL